MNRFNILQIQDTTDYIFYFHTVFPKTRATMVMMECWHKMLHVLAIVFLEY